MYILVNFRSPVSPSSAFARLWAMRVTLYLLSTCCLFFSDYSPFEHHLSCCVNTCFPFMPRSSSKHRQRHRWRVPTIVSCGTQSSISAALNSDHVQSNRCAGRKPYQYLYSAQRHKQNPSNAKGGGYLALSQRNYAGVSTVVQDAARKGIQQHSNYVGATLCSMPPSNKKSIPGPGYHYTSALFSLFIHECCQRDV